MQALKTWVQVLALSLTSSHLVLLSLTSLCIKWDQIILPVSQTCHDDEVNESVKKYYHIYIVVAIIWCAPLSSCPE